MKKNEAASMMLDLYRIKGMGEDQKCDLASMVKDVDQKKGIICGYASAFNIVDSDREIVMPGAFKRTIQQRGPDGSKRIAFLRQHRAELLLGRPAVMKEDQKGLYFESKISETSYGKDALILYQDGVINEHSIGFDVIKDQREQDQPTKLLELRLWDVSAVTWGANEQTPFVGMKSMNEWKKAFDQIENVNRALADSLTDDTAIAFEIWIRQFQQSMVDFVKSLRAEEPQKLALEAALKGSHQEIAKMLRKNLESIQSFTK